MRATAYVPATGHSLSEPKPFIRWAGLVVLATLTGVGLSRLATSNAFAPFHVLEYGDWAVMLTALAAACWQLYMEYKSEEHHYGLVFISVSLTLLTGLVGQYQVGRGKIENFRTMAESSTERKREREVLERLPKDVAAGVRREMKEEINELLKGRGVTLRVSTTKSGNLQLVDQRMTALEAEQFKQREAVTMLQEGAPKPALITLERTDSGINRKFSDKEGREAQADFYARYVLTTDVTITDMQFQLIFEKQVIEVKASAGVRASQTNTRWPIPGKLFEIEFAMPRRLDPGERLVFDVYSNNPIYVQAMGSKLPPGSNYRVLGQNILRR